MAITGSLGYGGTVGEDDIAPWRRSFPAAYGVVGDADWKVTIKPGVDRTLKIAAGLGYGHGVIDTNDAVETGATVQLPTLSGTGTVRWDLVVARRDWSGTGGTTTFEYVTGTSVQTAVFSSRSQTPGVEDDQPLALVRVVGNGGGGAIDSSNVIDLRVWASNGGMVGNSDLVVHYLTEPGTTVRVGSRVWTRTVSTLTGSAVWTPSTVAGVNPVAFLGQNGSFAATSPADDRTVWSVQAGTVGVMTDGGGMATLTFPTPFPNGLLTVVLSGGEDSETPDFNANIIGAPTKSGCTYRLWASTAADGGTRYVQRNKAHRLNWVAIGW